MTTIATDNGADTPMPNRGSPTPRRSRSRLVNLALVGVTILIGVSVAALVFGRLRPHLYSGVVLQSPSAAPALDQLQYANGQSVDLEAFRGDVVLLYFGYTNCPDVCPVVLSSAAEVRQELAADGRDVHLLMISVDPARDRLEELQAYVGLFDPDFLGVGGSAADIHRAATQYGVFYDPGVGEDTDEYTIDHTATLLGIGPEGRLRIVWSPTVAADALLADVDNLLG